MNFTPEQLVVWLIVGALAGSLVGRVVKWKKEGFGRYTNLGIGLAGALLGGTIVNVFNLSLGLPDIEITLRDLVAALLGSLVFLVILWIVRWQMQRREKRREKSKTEK